MSGMIDVVGFPGLNAVGVIDFNAVGNAAMNVTIGGQIYLEAAAADAPNGVWTNGASAATSAASLIAAINGDTRAGKPAVTAVASAVADSVVVYADSPGTAGNLAMTSSHASATVDAALHGGMDQSPNRRMAVVNYTVTAQDILADEVNIPLPFTPTGFVLNCMDATGLAKVVTFLAVIAASPARIFVNFAGVTDPIAGDIVHLVVWG